MYILERVCMILMFFELEKIHKQKKEKYCIFQSPTVIPMLYDNSVLEKINHQNKS